MLVVKTVPLTVAGAPPVPVPAYTRLESLGATAMAPTRLPRNVLACAKILPTVGAAFAWLDRHMVAPAIQRYCELLGSRVKGAMNRKFPAASVMPVRNAAKLVPPLVERCRDKAVFSAHSIFVLPGLTAT